MQLTPSKRTGRFSPILCLRKPWSSVGSAQLVQAEGFQRVMCGSLHPHLAQGDVVYQYDMCIGMSVGYLVCVNMTARCYPCIGLYVSG